MCRRPLTRGHVEPALPVVGCEPPPIHRYEIDDVGRARLLFEFALQRGLVGVAKDGLEESLKGRGTRVEMSDPLGRATDVCAGGESVFNFTRTANHLVVSHVDAREAVSVPVQEADEPEEALKLVALRESNLVRLSTVPAESSN